MFNSCCNVVMLYEPYDSAPMNRIAEFMWHCINCIVSYRIVLYRVVLYFTDTLKATDSQLLSTGNLHFSYLKMSDMQDGKLYKCNVYNPYLDFTRGGSYTRLQITPGTVMLSPHHLYSNAEALVCGIFTGAVDLMNKYYF